MGHDAVTAGFQVFDRGAVLELLFDLKHDLSKHLRLPLGMLPADAAPSAVRAALEEGLCRTRPGPGGARSARAIWEAFLAEWESGGVLDVSDLRQAVERALAWEDAVAGPRPLGSRAEVLADLDGVGTAIGRLIEAVKVA